MGHALGTAGFSQKVGHGLRVLALGSAAVLVLASCGRGGQLVDRPIGIGGPLGIFLAKSTDLGPSRSDVVEVTAALRDSTRPQALITWAERHDLSVHWRPGDNWAFIAGAPAAFGNAFGVTIHDYRRQAQVFYASQQQPEIPPPVRADVTELGRVINYNPTHAFRPPTPHLDVPNGAASPSAMMTTYNASRLGTTGKGQTIVFFELDKFDQPDFDKFTDRFKLKPLKPTVIGKTPQYDWGETPMDLEVAHGIAPDAKKVIIYVPVEMPSPARTAEQWANFFEKADQQFPGAIWSLSLGSWCDKIDTAADLLPMRAALAAALKHGTTVFISTGDTGGYECKGYSLNGEHDKTTPPTESEIGLSSMSSVPEVTGVGGTTLSTDSNAAWVTEAGWADYPLTQGTGGGVSNLFERPDWQQGVASPEGFGPPHPSAPDMATHRLSPDISSTADPDTGPLFYFHGKAHPGGGTSVAAPVWAALTALMNQYLIEHGGRAVGDLNPLLYQASGNTSRPAFHDPTIGGNAAYNCGPGYDLATGLGTPDTLNLVSSILDIQKAGR